LDGNSRSPLVGRAGSSTRRGRPFAKASEPLPRAQRIAYPLAILALAAVAWEQAAVAADSLLIPTFSRTLAALVRLSVSPRTLDAFIQSNQALAIGFLLSVAIGIPGGLALGRYRTLAKLLNPYVVILLVIPMAGVIPLLVMSVGIGLEARVAIVVLFAVVVVLVNSQAGVREADVSLIEMARSFGASETKIWRRILLPGAAPHILAGVRLGLGRAVTGMVAAELLLVATGVGRLVLEYQSQFDAASIYATVILIVVEALVLISAAEAVGRFVTPWRRIRR
jgi:NitT/TauT family transport system permease protein